MIMAHTALTNGSKRTSRCADRCRVQAIELLFVHWCQCPFFWTLWDFGCLGAVVRDGPQRIATCRMPRTLAPSR